MATPFLGEIRLMAFAFPPKGWALCNGQQLPINQNQALFALLGTMYGGNGTTSFALPDLQGRVPVASGQGAGLGSYTQGQAGGEAAHTLTLDEWVNHSHVLNGTRVDGNSAAPARALPAVGTETYSKAGSDGTMASESMASANANPQAHENMQPFLTLSYVIALQGIFPSHS
jgi:microcystin-dependent protein